MTLRIKSTQLVFAGWRTRLLLWIWSTCFLTLSVPHFFLTVAKWVYQSVQRHTGQSHLFNFFHIRAFWRSELTARVPECQKIYKKWVRRVWLWTLWIVTIWFNITGLERVKYNSSSGYATYVLPAIRIFKKKSSHRRETAKRSIYLKQGWRVVRGLCPPKANAPRIFLQQLIRRNDVCLVDLTSIRCNSSGRHKLLCQRGIQKFQIERFKVETGERRCSPYPKTLITFLNLSLKYVNFNAFWPFGPLDDNTFSSCIIVTGTT